MPKNSKGREVAEVIPDKCIACQVCLGACPVNAIDMKEGAASVNPSACIGCGKCFDVCPVGAVLYEKVRKKAAATAAGAPAAPSDYRGVSVFIEAREGRASGVSWELTGKAVELAARIQAPVFGFLPGTDVGGVAKEAIAYGCDRVFVVEDPLLKTYLPRTYGKAVVGLCRLAKPEILLLGATPLGRDLASVVATQLDTGLTADCTALDVDPKDRLLQMTRPTFGGNIMATILCRERRPQISTVRPRVMKMPQKDPSRKGEIERVPFEPPVEALPQIIEFISAGEAEGETIVRAQVLVVVGKGACDARQLPMFEELAQLLGGAVACSRPVVEAGLLPYVRQVGQTGKTVAPRMYIGIGVSGAVQHLVGMQGSERIIAINTDRNAPLARMADYALVGDYQEIVPELVKGLRSRLGVSQG